MAFFPPQFYNSETSFTPLFRLLDDFDHHYRGSPQQHGRRSAGLPSWQPKFDIRETAENYELHGELPGIRKDQVNIEFTDPQTMLIRGRVERSYSAGTPPAGAIEEAGERAAITEDGEASSSRNSLHQATVEDETDNNKTGVDEVAKTESAVEKKKPQDKAKYWLTERSIGEFSRSFNFPSRVDQDGVSAQFKDGILEIVVPKAKKHESRRIAIN
ncbi:putative heat shock protein 30 [Ophiocordyceps camponoti-floridani]|uniref:Putative heat shock protein 30 n=1 Tax=Ophiocordyceps camponoti-floridani TaxID=2030778 RepID=A0A8H4Q195_9HYPO|nr:putative heat shock protein 30 [Ophiocordyceps camponoti-floridani]